MKKNINIDVMVDDARKFYQHLYADTDYNWGANKGKCPGVKWFPLYKDWLYGYIYDWGCGNGETVYFLRDKGFVINGMDWVKLNNDMTVGDITDKHNIVSDTALCIDVLEHIPEIKINQVLENMFGTIHQVINVSNAPSIVENVELHVTKKPIEWWENKLSKYFKIFKRLKPRVQDMLFLCEGKY